VDANKEDWEALERLEGSLWRNETRFDKAYMDRILSEDYWEVGRSGRVYSRELALNAPARPIEARLPFDDLKMRQLAEGVMLLTYSIQDEYEGRLRRARRCSIWSHAPGGWRLTFHQGTPTGDDDPRQGGA
jgi:hypothetical protein